jgi:CRISPR/Cas system-associated exonuclease Cas4 (RecB family)
MSFIKPRIVAWSYSRLSTWEECPAKANYKFLQKLPEPDSPYAARGTHLHELAANYIQNKSDLAMQIGEVKDYLDELKHPDTQCEMQLAFDENWEPTEWFSPRVYCRVIFDAVKPELPLLTIADHKSGKKRPEEHTDQLRLYALAGFAGWPKAEVINAQIIYLDHAERLSMEFSRDKLDELKQYWGERAERMRNDDLFSPKPGKGCKWCHFRKANGGPCIF